MIDTLARHLAALSEARRLVRMVLVNNPAFVAYEQGIPDERTIAALGSDPNYAAFRHLNDAIAILTPEPVLAVSEPGLTLSDRILDIQPAVAAGYERPLAPDQPSHGAQDMDHESNLPSLPTLGDRLRYVLEEPPFEFSDGAAQEGELRGPSCGHDEAHVAIVRHKSVPFLASLPEPRAVPFRLLPR
jgi:hypothetical protein